MWGWEHTAGTELVSLTQRLGDRSPAVAEHTEAHLRQPNRCAEGWCEAAEIELQWGILQMTARRAGCRSHSSRGCYAK